MIKKRYIILVLGVVSVLFGSLLVNNIILAQTGGDYDPWLDYNEDGTVDVNDLSPLGQAYGSSGNPTKNVNVTNFPTQQPEPSWKAITIVENLNVTWNTAEGYEIMLDPFYFSVPIEGYSRMVIYARVINYTDVGGINNEAGIQVHWWYVYEYGHREIGDWDGNLGVGDLYWEYGHPTWLPVFAHSELNATLGPMLKMEVAGWSNTPNTPRPSTISCLVSIGMYLRNE